MASENFILTTMTIIITYFYSLKYMYIFQGVFINNKAHRNDGMQITHCAQTGHILRR